MLRISVTVIQLTVSELLYLSMQWIYDQYEQEEGRTAARMVGQQEVKMEEGRKAGRKGGR